MTETLIPKDSYKKIIALTPIPCVDVIIRSPNNKYLLIRRANEPLCGKWWVVGGRVRKEERLTEAARRKVKEEIGLTVGSLCPVGYYEGFYEQNAFGDKGIYHTLSVVFTTVIDDFSNIILDDQSIEWTLADALPEEFVFRSFGEPAD